MIYESIIAGLVILCGALIFQILMQRLRIKYLNSLIELYHRDHRYCEALLYTAWHIFNYEQWQEFRKKWKGIAEAHGREMPPERAR